MRVVRIALCWLALCVPALAQIGIGNQPNIAQLQPAPSGAAYSGPGDVQGTGWVWWFGLRAFSAATAGTKAANICNSGDATCNDVNTLANGNFDVATATGAPLNCGGAGGTCTVKILYDKSGGTNCTTACNFTQATPASRPILVFNCINTTLPCIRWSSATTAMTTPAMTGTFTQPFSASFVYKNTAAGFSDYVSLGGQVAINLAVSTNTLTVYAGSFPTTASTDGVFHSVQATWNNSSPTNTVSVDGTLSNASPGAANATTPVVFFGSVGSGDTSDTGEFGFNSNSFVGAPATALCHNQRLYWGTGGSC